MYANWSMTMTKFGDFFSIKLQNGLICYMVSLATDCPDGWLAFDGSCYWFSRDAMNFVGARVRTLKYA